MDPVELHVEEGTQVWGYLRCTCGTLVLETTWHMTNGLCMACYTAGKSRSTVVTEVYHQGRRINLPKPPSVSRGKRNRGKGHHDPLRKRAKLRALKRLGDLYPEMFAMLYAEERLRVGLAPVPLRTYDGVAERGAETVDDAWFYAALSEAGGLPDGPA